jgi:hypothetical protein
VPDETKSLGLLDARRVELLREGHYLELARGLARHWWRRRFGKSPPAKMPRLSVANAYLARRHWEARLKQAWVLAVDQAHRPMSLKEFHRFRADLAKLNVVNVQLSESHHNKEDS